MANRTVRQGECVASIAFELGLNPKQVWGRSENAALREERKDMYVLAPGDELFVPDLVEKEAARGTARRHVFRRREVPEKLHLQLRVGAEAERSVPYRLVIDDGVEVTGATNGEGEIEHDILPDARSAVLVLRPDTEQEETIEILIGALDPVTTDEGLIGRLMNLGLLDAEQPTELDLTEAVEVFQMMFLNAEEPSGTADEETRAKLVEVCGC